MKLKNKKTAEIGYLCFANWNDPVLIISDNNGTQLAKYKSRVELEREWEDYEETKGWYIDISCVVRPVEPFFGDENINILKQCGNFFDTREKAEKAVEKLKALKRLKDKDFDIFNEAVVTDSAFCLDIFIGDDHYKDLKDDLKIVFGR